MTCTCVLNSFVHTTSTLGIVQMAITGELGKQIVAHAIDHFPAKPSIDASHSTVPVLRKVRATLDKEGGHRQVRGQHLTIRSEDFCFLARLDSLSEGLARPPLSCQAPPPL